MESSLSEVLKALQRHRLRRAEANRKFVPPTEGQCAVRNWLTHLNWMMWRFWFERTSYGLFLQNSQHRAIIIGPRCSCCSLWLYHNNCLIFFFNNNYETSLFYGFPPVDWESLWGGNGNSTSTSAFQLDPAGGRGNSKVELLPWFYSLRVCLEKLARL